MAAEAKVKNLLDNNPVVVFSKTYCNYCNQTKALLNQLGAKYEVLELNQIDDGSDIQAYLGKKYGKITVPKIIIKHEYIGGDDELQAMERSELIGKLKKAGAM